MLSNILNLIENDAVRVVDPEESNDGAENGHAKHDLVVGDGEEEDIIVLDALGGVIFMFFLLASLDSRINHHGLRRCANWAGHAGGWILDVHASQSRNSAGIRFRSVDGAIVLEVGFEARNGRREFEKKKWRGRPSECQKRSTKWSWADYRINQLKRYCSPR